MARERQVFPREQVAHLFAVQAQDSARDPSDNFYFNGDTIYSYGPHYAIARILPEHYTRDGARVVLFNSSSYSRTTGRHRDIARQALRHMDFIDIPDLCGKPRVLDAAETLINTMRAKVKAATAPRIKPTTRAAHIRNAAIAARDAAYLLRTMLDNGKAERATAYSDEAHSAARKRARQLLRAIPAQDAFPYVQDMAHKDAQAAAETFAAPMLRDEYRADMARHLESFRHAYRDASAEVENASYRLYCAKVALQHFMDAMQAARLGNARIPVQDRKAAESLRESLPAMQHATDMEARAEIEDWFNRHVDEVRDLIATDPEYRMIPRLIGSAKTCALELSATDTAEQAAARDNIIEQLDKAHADALQASAPERYAAALAAARECLDRGRYVSAMGAASRAVNIAADNGLDDSAARTLREQIETAQRDANRERVAAWRNGRGPAYLDRGITGGDHAGALLRHNAARGVIETSWGADVPATVAPIVWRLVNAARRNAAELNFAGNAEAPKLGHYTLDRVTAGGDIRVGCHLIRYSELARMAEVLGLPQPEGVAA